MANDPRLITKDFKKEITKAIKNKEEIIFDYWTSQGEKTRFQGIPIRFCQKDKEEAFVLQTIWGKGIKLRLASCGKQGKDNALEVKFNNDYLKLKWEQASNHYSGIWALFLPASKTRYGKKAVSAKFGNKEGNPSQILIPVYAFTINKTNDAGEAKGEMIYPELVSSSNDTNYYSLSFKDNTVSESILPCRLTKSGKVYAFHEDTEHKAEKLKSTSFSITFDSP